MCICKDDGNKGYRYKVVSKINHKGLSEQTILQRVNSGLIWIKTATEKW